MRPAAAGLLPLPILVHHDGVIAIDKPAGLPSTGRTLDDPDCAQARLMAQLGRRKVWAVHQLDAGTTGLNLFALRKARVAEVGEAMRPPRGRKTYLAVARGRWEGGERLVDLPIGSARGVPAVTRDGKPSQTRVRPLAVGADASLLEVALLTGRTHQVRVHLAAVGHPLIGDAMHGDPGGPTFGRPALHAHRLRLDLPAPLDRLEAPAPADLRRLCLALGLELP